jgi:phage portal protein BeeE
VAEPLPAVIRYPPGTIIESGAPTFWDNLRQWFFRPKTSPQNAPTTAMGGFAMISQEAGRIGTVNAATYRAWAQTPWVAAAIDIRKDQLAAAEWDIVPYRHDGRRNVRLAQRIRDLFDTPNAIDADFHGFIQRLVGDLLTLDAGVAEIVRTPDRDIAELWPTPGEFIRVNARWDGSNPSMPRYYWYPDGTEKDSFLDSDMLYIMDNPRTNSPVGVSPIHILRTVIDSELQAQEYNRRMVMGAAPDGVLHLGEGALGEDVERTKSKFENEVFGKSSMGVIGGYKNPTFLKFRDSNRDFQYREWIDLLLRCIAVVYGLSPMDLGITFDVNRSTSEAQGQMSEDRGLRPLMSLIQRNFTRKIVWDESFGGRDNNLAFKWTALNLDETMTKANINKISMPGVPTKSINEARRDAGREPIGDMNDEANVFNHLIVQTPKGMLDITTGTYLGEEQLAQLQQETARAKAEAAPEPIPTAPSAEGTPDE